MISLYSLMDDLLDGCPGQSFLGYLGNKVLYGY